MTALLLGVLAVPNAVLAGTSYLAGPGFAVGAGTHVGLTSAPHGLLPAFPVLGALPGQPAGIASWLLAVATPLFAGWLAVRVLPDRASWGALARDFALVAAIVGVVLGLLAELAGGGIGTGRLATVGASPWLLALSTAGGVLVSQWVVMGGLAGREWLRARGTDDAAPVEAKATTEIDSGATEIDSATAVTTPVANGAEDHDGDADDPAEADELAG